MPEKREHPVARIALLMAVSLSGLSAQAKYSGGSGTAQDPYRIASKKDLLAFAAETKDYGSHILLTADINLSGQTFTMALIAPATKVGTHLEFLATPFTGVFNGNGHKITGLTIDDQNHGHDYLGLFGCIAQGGSVKNLRLERVKVINCGVSHYIGGLVGRNDGGIITSCSVDGNVDGGDMSDYVGGLVGHNTPGATISWCEATCAVTGGDTGIQFGLGGLVGRNGGLIKHCRATGNVAGEGGGLGGLAGWNEGMIINCSAKGKITGGDGGSGTGGLVGRNERGAVLVNCNASGAVVCNRHVFAGGGFVGENHGAIIRCWATDDVTGGAVDAGGLVGDNFPAATIDNSYATGSVAGVWGGIGGLVGLNTGTIVNCYAVGKSGGDSFRIGGLVGTSVPGQTVNSFWDTQTSGQSKSEGGTGKTTAQMQIAKTFRDASWDFNCIWDIEEGRTYPFLRLGLVADLNCEGRVDLRDYARLAANWSKTCSFTNPKAPAVKCPLAGDLTCDRQVNAQDLALMAAQWLENR